ncbi:hypothetical protein VTK26DRAFT_8763 [Humicola hyalothermophila]
MPTDIIISSGRPTATDTATNIGTSSENDSGIGSNRTLVITLSTVLSAVGLVLIAGVVLICWRRGERRLPFLSRGVSPIDDEEIAAWKTPRDDEKSVFPAGDTDVETDGAFNKETGGPSHAKHPSTSSVKKPPSVIVYSNVNGRPSTDGESRRSLTHHRGKSSLDRTLPQTPILARAPNARAGLTDESVPGDEPFIASPKRNPSRLSKLPPNSNPQRRAAHHSRTRSSRSSTRSFGDSCYGPGTGSGGGSDAEPLSRHSHDLGRRSRRHHHHHHSRVYSSSSVPPRLSLDNEALYGGGSSPARPLFRERERAAEPGRAVG